MHGDLRAVAEDAVHDRLAEVQVELVAKLIALGLVRTLPPGALVLLRVLAVVRLLELGVDLAERLLADLADAARR